MNKILKSILFLLFIIGPRVFTYSQWIPDDLGGNFEKKYIRQQNDYNGTVFSTIIRLKQEKNKTKRGVLYIHGFNDYFFQSELAEEFVKHGYDFYAIDLRKYGRSLTDSQNAFEVRNLNEYFPDIDSALTIMKSDGIDLIALMGHSTGGLICAYYIHQNPMASVNALILNSPFLDWNLGKIEWFVPVVSFIGRFLPDIKIPQSNSIYGKTLDKKFYGEWEYNTKWKRHESTDVTTGWVRAINNAQNILKKEKYQIKIPILLMYSSASYFNKDWSIMAQKSDAVLDVNDIKKYGLTLGKDVTPVKVHDGLHDLFLSSKEVRYPLYNYVFKWLEQNL